MKNIKLLTIAFIAGITLSAVAFSAHNVLGNITCIKVTYVNPGFACGNNAVISKAEYTTLRNDITDYITRQENAGTLTHVSMYFRDLENGPAFGVKADADYAPASLLKLPMIVAFFNLSEDDASLLSTPLKYASSEVEGMPPSQQHEMPTPDIVEGGAYSIQDLMRNTIEYSDNLSFFILLKYINYSIPSGRAGVLRSFQELGVIDPRNPDEPVVSVRGYAGLFRTLYHASYLSVANSEKLLDWLAHSKYDKGITAGTPSEVTVANKFGERLLDDGSKQLHDCGVIYFPDNPYVLCVMTQGDDWDALAQGIAAISKMVYEEVDSRRLDE